MKHLSFLLILASTFCFAQEEFTNNSRYQLTISYGPQYNNFVDYDQDVETVDGYILPLEGFPGEDALLQKREIGTYFNATFSLRIGGRNYLEIGHSRTLNQGVYNGIVFFPIGTRVEVRDFQLRHRNHFFKLGYKRVFNDRLSAHIGLAQVNDQRSVINIFPATGNVQIAERNYENANSAEGIAYIGAEYDLYSSGRFTIGVKSTAYFIISYGPELETFTISPSLRFNF
ncbi:hypothetical protein FNJ87_15455 [Nonlabens mediterrranea]|uniref:Outer membrane protein beta-barrel domain-containing protein n=1 Tax=Nonlabens mediterrranea TaxID=1419947 RepID=A0ABS0A8J8_9FLAO|nr:hypothetical protein [Nonlabens mediterrranea]